MRAEGPANLHLCDLATELLAHSICVGVVRQDQAPCNSISVHGAELITRHVLPTISHYPPPSRYHSSPIGDATCTVPSYPATRPGRDKTTHLFAASFPSRARLRRWSRANCSTRGFCRSDRISFSFSGLRSGEQKMMTSLKTASLRPRRVVGLRGGQCSPMALAASRRMICGGYGADGQVMARVMAQVMVR